jgi:prepilin-type N-terminal cleavage/methylation domain-containing protein
MKLKPQAAHVRGKLAFTLIEIMVAMGIFAMVMAAIFSSWTAILRGSRISATAAREVQRTRIAMRALQEALASAQMYADNPKYYVFYADTSGKYPFLSFVARLPASFPGSGLFEGQTLRRVSFSVEKGKSGGNELLLSQYPILEKMDKTTKPYTISLTTDVSFFSMEFFDIRKGWLPEWTSTNQLPKLVRVALAFGKRGRISRAPEDVTIRVIPMGNSIARIGPRPGAGGQPGGGIVVNGQDDPMWGPQLPQDWATRRTPVTKDSFWPD